jgi:hypothetical protein
MNTVLTPDILQAALDLIAKGIVQPTKIAKALNVPYRTYRSGLVRSNRGDENFLIEVDGEVMQWAKAINLHTRLAMFELRGLVTQYSIFGDDEISYKDGQVVWALDPVAAAMSEDEREALGFRRDALLEINGALQPVKMHKRAPIALQLRLLEATFKDMRPSTVQEVNLNGNVAVGIGYAPPIDYSKPPVIPPLPVPPDVPQIEATDAEFSEVDPELEAILGPAPVPVSITIALPALEPGVINMPSATMSDDQDINEDQAQASAGSWQPEPVGATDAPTEQPVVDRVICDTPTAAETPTKQEGVLAPPLSTKSIPAGWRAEWERLNSRGAALPDKLNRG